MDRVVEYESDGVVMRGRLAVPEGPGPFPAVLVAHEANGLDEFQAARPAALAEAGYAALALDYYGDGLVFDAREPMMEQLERTASDVDALRRRARAALDLLVAQPGVDPDRVAATGYCFGATVALELARTGADLKAVVGFHPGLNSFRPEDTPNIRARILLCIGADDPMCPPDLREAWAAEMDEAGVPWEMALYGGVVHSFTHPRSSSFGEGLRYDERAAARSWRAMLDLFAEVL